MSNDGLLSLLHSIERIQQITPNRPPVKFTMVEKEDIPKVVPTKPAFKIPYNPKFLIDSEGDPGE